MDDALADLIAQLRRDAARDLGRPSAYEHVWSCPGCWCWQLHCTDEVAAAWDPQSFADMVEDIIREHVAHECPAPALVLALLRSRGH
jgi:hypothetical protein